MMKSQKSAKNNLFAIRIASVSAFLLVVCAVPEQGFSQTTTATQAVKVSPKKTPAAKKKTAPKPAAPKANKATSETLCVAQLNVVEGCEVCETMMGWLKKGGVKLKTKEIETGKYKLYPTVEYSDKSTDHGEKIYEQTAQIPQELQVVRCKSVSN